MCEKLKGASFVKLRNLFEKLLGKGAETGPVQTEEVLSWERRVEPHYTYGMHRYRREGEDATVYYIDPALGVKRKVVDSQGNILGFPGIEKEDFWVSQIESPGALKGQVRFRSDFEKCGDGRWAMLWQVQPDGRYWGDDDGFGMEHDVEIYLYSILNERGEFAEPFRIYSMGMKEYVDIYS